jgi:hypothetical protein
MLRKYFFQPLIDKCCLLLQTPEGKEEYEKAVRKKTSNFFKLSGKPLMFVAIAFLQLTFNWSVLVYSTPLPPLSFSGVWGWVKNWWSLPAVDFHMRNFSCYVRHQQQSLMAKVPPGEIGAVADSVIEWIGWALAG